MQAPTNPVLHLVRLLRVLGPIILVLSPALALIPVQLRALQARLAQMARMAQAVRIAQVALQAPVARMARMARMAQAVRMAQVARMARQALQAQVAVEGLIYQSLHFLATQTLPSTPQKWVLKDNCIR